MFRNDRQISTCCIILLRSLRRESLWTAEGPTRLACDYLENGSPMSSGEHLLLRACFDFWNGDGKVTLGEMRRVFDEKRTRLVATLMMAERDGAEAVDRWINEESHG